MGLDPRQAGIVGFILKESGKEPGELEPDGTFFVVNIRSTEYETEALAFLVTAQHNVINKNKVFAIMHSDKDEAIGWELSNLWFYPDDPSLDLAIHPLFHDSGAPERPASVWPLDVTSTTVDALPRLGERVLYVGLHKRIRATWEHLNPVVRVGAMAALWQPDVSWGEGDQWGPTLVHLIDCQAVRGYSGAPCFMESQFPGPRIDLVVESPPVLPDPWVEQLAKATTELKPGDFGAIYNFHALMGMLVSIDKKGIGIVLPIGHLHNLASRHDVQAWISEQIKTDLPPDS